MMKIINGKRYNTETAIDVLALDCGLSGVQSRSDFKWEDTALYITKRGQWFLAGEGGPMSRWARRVGNMYGYGSGIMPISVDEAQEILEQHGQTELVEKYFGYKVTDA